MTPRSPHAPHPPDSNTDTHTTDAVVTVEKTVYGGRGLAHLPDGRAVFIPFTAPGDRIRAQIVSEHKRYAKARIIDIFEASPCRRRPRCPHFGMCGGCAYQHLVYAEQTSQKSKQLRETLARLGPGEDALPPAIESVGAPEEYGYRNKISLHAYLDAEGQKRFGFSAAADNTPFTPTECHLPLPPLAEFAMERLAEFATCPDSVPAEVERVTFRMSSTGTPTAWFDQLAPGQDWLTEEIAGESFAVPPGAFWQINPQVASLLVERVAEWTSEGGSCLVDAYAGVGVFAATAGKAYNEQVVIEQDRRALKAARRNLQDRNLTKAEFAAMPAEAALNKLLNDPKREAQTTTVVLDPPRAGCGVGVLRTLQRRRPAQVLYVSCDPATLARDLRTLVGKGPYRITRLAMLDMFPQTAHFETMAMLVLPRT